MDENKNHWYDGLFYDKFIAPNQDKAETNNQRPKIISVRPLNFIVLTSFYITIQSNKMAAPILKIFISSVSLIV